MTDIVENIETPASNETPVETSDNNDTNPVQNTETVTPEIIKTEPVEKVVKPDWREDWLDKMAGTDEKAKNILGKYASPKGVGDALVSLTRKQSSYKPEVSLPENPTEEDLNKYRKAYNIPESPDKYDTKLDKGIVIGENDKPLVDKFLQKAHGLNMKPDEVKRAMQIHFENLQEENEAINAKVAADKAAAEDELRAEWGTNFRQNANVINNFLANKFGDDADNLKNAVLADGTILSQNPKMLRTLLAISQDIDPIATLGGSSDTTASSIQTELDKIRSVMKTNPSKYFNDKGLVKRYEELTITNEKLKSRQ